MVKNINLEEVLLFYIRFLIMKKEKASRNDHKSTQELWVELINRTDDAVRDPFFEFWQNIFGKTTNHTYSDFLIFFYLKKLFVFSTQVYIKRPY